MAEPLEGGVEQLAPGSAGEERQGVELVEVCLIEGVGFHGGHHTRTHKRGLRFHLVGCLVHQVPSRNNEGRKGYQRWIQAVRREVFGELRRRHPDEYEALYEEAKARVPYNP